jgi:hypothetical protein
MNSKVRTLICVVLLTLLAACQAVPQSTAPAANPPSAAALVITAVPLPPASAPTPAAQPSLAPPATAAEESTTQPAEKTVSAYFSALQAADPKSAASLLSTFSLTHAAMTRGDAAAELQGQLAQGAAWSGLQIKESKVFDSKTVLVHVVYQLASKDAKTGKAAQAQMDELWPVRLESGQWLYNRKNLIDFHTLDVQERTISGLTVKPRELVRYTDHLSLTLLAQNATNDAVVWGTSNQVLATFHFGSQAVDAVQSVIIIDRLRSYPGVAIDVKGLFPSYPDSVDLVKYVHFTGGPWATFQLGS